MSSLTPRLFYAAAVLAVVVVSGCIAVPPGGYPPPYAMAPANAPPDGYGQPPAYPQQSYAPVDGYGVPSTYAPPATQVAYATTCYAGVYTCPLPQAAPAGTQCSCPGLGAPSFGTAH